MGRIEDETKNNNYRYYFQWRRRWDDFQIQESDNRVLMTIKNGGNVGIGTTSPRAKVEIKNTADTDNDLLIYSTSTEYGEPEWARIGLMREGDPDEGFLGFYGNAAAEYPSGIMLGVRGANPIRFNNNELERMRISPDGNVGIGTVKPLKKLDVAGDLRFNYNALIAGFDSSIDSNYDHIWVNDGDQVYGGNAIGNWVFAHDSGYKAAGNSALVAGNVWMRGSTFDNYFAGNVGIGTTSPDSKLEIAGSEYVELQVNQTDSGSIHMGVTSGSAIGFLLAESNMSGVDPELRFLLKDESQSSGYSEAMRIHSSLNVGIGTTNPGSKLDVNGEIRVRDAIRFLAKVEATKFGCLLSLQNQQRRRQQPAPTRNSGQFK